MARHYPKNIQDLRAQLRAKIYGFSSRGHAVYALVSRIGREKRPVYVGESNDPTARFEQHLEVAYGGRDEGRRRGGRFQRIIAAGGTIEMHHLATTPCRISALAHEAGWARSLSRRGFRLENSWREHGLSSTESTIPVSRLKRLNLEEARLARIGLSQACSICLRVINLPWERIQELHIGTPMLSAISARLRCPICQAASVLRLTLPEEIIARCQIVEPTGVTSVKLV